MRDFVRSLPTRERGLKWQFWKFRPYPKIVAPYAGAWIEIIFASVSRFASWSLPTRERGLKSFTVRIPDEKTGRSLRGSVD